MTNRSQRTITVPYLLDVIEQLVDTLKRRDGSEAIETEIKRRIAGCDQLLKDMGRIRKANGDVE